ncbi:MOSC domain-containing protein [Nocardioides sp. CN2-186]|uniref:MOSC domain-containing protein n=1 Tax=Nocardioides tweenelious TaxID=3156607 RepID=UPI0032B6122A
MEGTVVTALHVAPTKHAPMEVRDELVVEEGAGIVGDRFHGTRHRHVTVQSADDLAEAAVRRGAPVPPEATRRNITIDGPVPREPGARLQVGDVLLEVVRVAAPCRIMETSIGPGGQEALRHRGGSVFRALSSGRIRRGDAVRPA